ncbi:ABC transporter substrate-binding protein [Massilia sp. CMS3.1]|uniref:ABC transporter substrate-binding protein n=1 Tax=Massilia sp. CMS3.1 TaxID=3373083 RepID=UPI003EE4917B
MNQEKTTTYPLAQRGTLRYIALTALLAGSTGLSHAADNGKFRIGVVTFLSGAAAGPFGVPAANAAKLTVDALNAGQLPAPYNKKGINGLDIEIVMIDENGGATKQSEEFRNLVQRAKVDAVVGYISSGDCLAIAPVAEELKMPTVLFDCGTTKLFESLKSPKYVFRTSTDTAVDSIAAARYLFEMRPQIKTAAGIQQNYAWGQDSWTDFTLAMNQLKPAMKIVSEQWPKLGQGQYGAEISALAVANADVIHSSMWGGDMEAFVLQAGARGLFERKVLLLAAGETGISRYKDTSMDGTIIGARGAFGAFAPKNTLTNWYKTAYVGQFKLEPTYPAHHMVQALLALKAAAEKSGKTGMPTSDQIITGLTGLVFESVSGTVKMDRAGGHQASQQTAMGELRFNVKTGKVEVTQVKVYAADCVTPPDGAVAVEWIKSGFVGAKCGK